MSENLSSKRERALLAAEKAVDELIKVLEAVIPTAEGSLGAEKMKMAAMAKRVALDDVLWMIDKIEKERTDDLESGVVITTAGKNGFAEGRAHTKKK